MHLAPSSNKHFEAVPLTFSLARALDYVPAFHSDVEEDNIPNTAAVMVFLHHDLILPDAKRILSIAEASNSTIVVSTNYTFPIAHIFCEKAASAICALQQGDVISYKSEKNLELHFTFLQKTFVPSLEAMNKERSDFGLALTTIEDICSMSSNPNIHIVAADAASPRLPPECAYRGFPRSRIHTSNLEPSASAARLGHIPAIWPPPSVVTYGSMKAQGVALALMRALLSGIIEAGVQRLVIVPGNAQLGLHHLDEESDKSLLAWAKGQVFVTKGSVQYSWLLSQYEMIFSHCGAGTTCAALQAGIPILGAPIFVDQIFLPSLSRGYNLRTASVPLDFQVSRSPALPKESYLCGNKRCLQQ